MSAPAFPRPVSINRRNYWRAGDLRAHDAAVAQQQGLEPAPADPRIPDEAMLTAKQVCARYGGVSVMTLWRWMHRAPAPAQQAA